MVRKDSKDNPVTSVVVSKDTMPDLQELKAWASREAGKSVTMGEALRLAAQEYLGKRRTAK